MEADTEPRVVDVPPDLRGALGEYPKAEAFFQLLSYTHQREYVRWVEEAKRAETRRDRITETGRWATARFWLFPSLAPSTATVVAGVFWVVSAIGFVVAAMSFWGVLVPGGLWRQFAVASSIVSATGIVLVLGTWPAFNTIAALGANIAVLVSLLLVHWPPVGLFGK